MEFSTFPDAPVNICQFPPLALRPAEEPGAGMDALPLPSGWTAPLEEWRAAAPARRYFTLCRAVGRVHTLTGRAAAGVLGLDIWPVPSEVDIRATSRGSVGMGPDVGEGFRLRGHLDRSEPRYFDGVFLVDPADAILRCALLSPPRGRTVLFESLVRRLGSDPSCPLPAPALLMRELVRPKWRRGRGCLEDELAAACRMLEAKDS